MSFPRDVMVLATTMAALSGAGCGGHHTQPAPRTGETAASELLEYAQFVRDVHPAPYRFVTAEAFDQKVGEEAAALRGRPSPTDLEVAGGFQRVLAALRDSHVAVTAGSFQPGAEGVQFLPLLVKDVEGVLRIDAGADGLEAGASLLAVEGVPVDELRAALSALAISDGVGELPRLRALERDFTKLYHLGYGTSARYRVRFGSADGTEREVIVDGTLREGLQALQGRRRSAPVWGAPARDAEQFPFTVEAVAGATWLRMSSFGSADQDGYRARVDSIMAAAPPTAPLVVDLRGNEGGLRTHGIAILNHVLAHPYQQWVRLTTRIRVLPEAYQDRASAAFGADLRSLLGFPEPTVGGLHVIEGDPLASRMVPSGGFSGRVLLLVDGRTNSAANELVIALVHERPDTVVIGEEVGGNCAEHIGELPVSWTTPTFGVSVLLSVIRLEHVSTAGCETGRGLAPTVAIRYGRSDFDAGRDPYLAAVQQALR